MVAAARGQSDLVNVLNHDRLDLGNLPAHAIDGISALICAVEGHAVLQHAAELSIVLISWCRVGLLAHPI